MTSTENTVKVLRNTRVNLDGGESRGMSLTGMDIFEIQQADGTTAVLGRSETVPGSGFNGHPVPSELWHLAAHGDFNRSVKANVDQETRLGHIVGEPVVTIAPGEPVDMAFPADSGIWNLIK